MDAQLHFFDAESNPTDLDNIVNDCVDYHAHFCNSFNGVYMPDATLLFLECNTNEQLTTSLCAHDVKNKPPDYQALRPLLAWLPTDIIKKTFKVTTQYTRMPVSANLTKSYCTPLLRPYDQH